jgi:hypothetical protein
MENNINIIRFKDGLDVICSMENINAIQIKITDPMIFEIRNGNLLLQNWLPVDIMKNNSVVIGVENILCVFEPNDDFLEYYVNTIQKVNEILKNKQSQSEEEITNLMEAISEIKNLKGNLIH